MHEKYPRLFEPLKVNHVVLKNRIISAPLGSNTDKSLSGIGMIIRGTSGSVDDPRMRLSPGPYCFADLFTAAKVREQVSVMRQAGAKAEFELCHCGQFAMVEKGDYAIGPVSFVREDGTQVRAMDEAMMEDIANKFARSALDAKEYGFDSVLLHFAHGWLPAQFLSPYFNKRTDGYGGPLENRIRFPRMIVDKVREAVGPDYMLDMRISGDEHLDGGMPIDEVIAFLQTIEDKIDMAHISCGVEVDVNTKSYMSSTAYLPHLINIELSRKVKDALHIPVAVVGGIMTPEEAESVLEGGYADAVVIGRQLIADPWWVKKAWESRSEDITPCIRCMNCYNPYQYHTKEELKAHTGLNTVPCCSVNPRYLHEDRVPNKLEKAAVRKKVVIIGGGPAGMKAALTADERGHEVHLYEKESVLGGQLLCAEYDEMKQDLKRYKDHLITQIRKSAVTVHLNTAATPEMFEKDKPDALILALGADPVILDVRGKEDEKVLDCIEAYRQMDQIGHDVVIIGGGSIGCELGLELARKGRNVSVVARRTILRNLNDIMKASLKLQMKQCEDLHVYTYTNVKEITKEGVIVSDRDGKERLIKADTVVMAVGMKSRIDEANSFYGIVQDTNVIGDANRVGTVWTASEDGYYIAAHM
ncbi:MAG: FAD-dependent oxidoreductase [Erysipelotrichaceae bacterium]|nr:FAD-dependent oxidoreductase [Erysipelotrichaceae bacterium]